MKISPGIPILLSFSLLFILPSSIFTQCKYFEDFSNPSAWTQIGNLVEIHNGKVNFINGSPDDIQRRIYKYLDEPYSSDECWQMTMEFMPTAFGQNNGHPYAGHCIFGLTENTEHPLFDCPDLPCTGFQQGSQDAIVVNVRAENPPDGDIHYKIIKVVDGEWEGSEVIIYNDLDQLIYVELTKNFDQLSLNLFIDEEKTVQIGSRPVSVVTEPMDDLEYIQHGNNVGGWYTRELSALLDNVCIKSLECEPSDLIDYCLYDIYPNPAMGYFYIEELGKVQCNEWLELEWFDIKGAFIKKEQLKLKGGKFRIDPTFPAGVYLIRIYSAKQKRHQILRLVLL